MKPWLHSLNARSFIVQLLGLAVVLGAVGLFHLQTLRQSVHGEAARVGETAAAIFREELGQHPERLQPGVLQGVADRLSGKLVNVSRLRFLDASGTVVADSRPLQQDAPQQTVGGTRKGTIQITAPILGRYDPVRRSNQIGTVVVEVDLALAERRVRRSFLQSMLLLLALIPLYWLIEYFALGRSTSRRLRTTASAATALAAGDYSARARVRGRDEIGQLGSAFDAMAAELQSTHERLQLEIHERHEIQQRIGELNRILEAGVELAQTQNRVLGVLNELSRMLQASSSLTEALEILPGYCKTLLQDSSGMIYLLHPSRDHLERVAEFGAPQGDDDFFNPANCWALRLGKTHAARAGSPLLCAHIGDALPGVEYQCAPLQAQSDALGMLHLQFNDGEGEVEGAAQATRNLLVAALSEQVGIALANLKLRETLRQQSIKDPLTGLFNRRYLEETLQREIDRAQRIDDRLVVVMLDVDHFKRFNDTFGHDAGDHVLKQVGRILSTSTRSSDIACRHGGEEFVLVLPQAGIRDGIARAEQIRQLVAELSLNFGGRPLGPLTVSLGVASIDAQTRSADALLKRADELLFDAKRQGRDRVVAESDPDAVE
ncbi:diguanylate cyclase [Lysobacter sp. A3-1-A15]|uniref:diguanylate cyclase n=1 Tax=Novilysobacter viscosus TaxID=3098602 RepID=UPI002ED902E4